MNKKIIGIIVVIAIVSLVVAFVFMKPNEEKNEVPENNTVEETNTSLTGISVVEELSALVDRIYEGEEENLPALQTQIIDTSDSDMVKYVTGLENGNDIEFAVASEPLMTSQAYSLVLVKVKEGVNADEVAKTMNENIDARKWICVTADAVYSTSSGNIVCLVMSNRETASTIFNRFKELARETGPDYEKNEEEIELPEDMY